MALCRFERFAHQRRVHRSISPSGAVAAVVMQIVQHSVIERGELAAFFHFSAAARERHRFLISSHVTRGAAHAHYRAAASTWSVGRSVLISGNPGQTFLLQLLSAGDASNSLSARLAWRWVSECVCRPRAAAPGRRPVSRGAGTRRRPPKGPSARSAVLSGDVNAFIPCLCWCALFVVVVCWPIVVDGWCVQLSQGRFLSYTCDSRSWVSRFRYLLFAVCLLAWLLLLCDSSTFVVSYRYSLFIFIG